MSGIEFLQALDDIIAKRIDAGESGSYTVELANSGVKRIAQKVGEEAIELAIASVDRDREEVLAEAGDLVYHMLVLLRVQGMTLADVSELLERRHSGR